MAKHAVEGRQPVEVASLLEESENSQTSIHRRHLAPVTRVLRNFSTQLVSRLSHTQLTDTLNFRTAYSTIGRPLQNSCIDLSQQLYIGNSKLRRILLTQQYRL